ncbi:MAG: hypothetical protein HYS18_04305 [Burkholderiales bacterium]|nr:hypothetical protein [Burkholderiales bacterium]
MIARNLLGCLFGLALAAVIGFSQEAKSVAKIDSETGSAGLAAKSRPVTAAAR